MSANTTSGRSILQHARETVGPSEGIPIGLGDSAAIDAFNRLRVSEPAGLFDTQLQYDTSPIFWESAFTGTAAAVTHLPDESAARLTVGASDTVTRQSRAYHRYQPGKSQLIMMTFVLSPPSLGVDQRVGYFDDENGLFLAIDSADALPYIILRSFTSGTAVDTPIAQADWNLDTLDGSGGDGNPSGITLDITQSQILIIDLEWLGVGRSRIGFVIDGLIVYCHEFLRANSIGAPYMTTANLPLRYQIGAGAGVTGTYSMRQICSMVSSEGGFDTERGIPMSIVPTGTTSITARRPILSIRPQTTFNAITNRGTIIPEGYTIFTDDQDVFYEIIYGGFLSGAAFVPVNGTFSQAEYDASASSISGGFAIESGIVEAGTGPGANQGPGSIQSALLSKLPMALDANGDHPAGPILTDNLTVVVASIPGTATDTAAALNWRELR
ncbi:MAG: hypothetical protein V3W44_02060 [Dehalococcoidales bacterium]